VVHIVICLLLGYFVVPAQAAKNNILTLPDINEFDPMKNAAQAAYLIWCFYQQICRQ
jgi:hypothetical protein